MLSKPLDLGAVDATRLFDFLYGFFHRDFIARRTHLNSCIHVDPLVQRKEDGKALSFWHLTSRTQSYTLKVGNRYENRKERLPDFDRSSRIEWVRQIIEGHAHDKVRLFYHRETTANQELRLYLWAHQDDFVVILQKLGKSSSFLVTSFFITHEGKRRDFQQRLNHYASGAMKGCEWF